MTFIGWKVAASAPPVTWRTSAPIAVVAGGGSSGEAEALGGGHAAGEEAHRRALDVALDAGDLAGEAQPRVGAQPHAAVEQPRRVQEGVAVDAAEPGEGGVLEAGDRPEHLGLRAVLHLGLEADEVVERAERVVAAELDDGVGLHVGRVRVGQADRLQRAEAQGLAAALGHHLDRQAALEVRGVALPVLELGLVGGEERVDEGLVLVAVHRAVEVGGALGLGLALVVARLEPGLGEVDRVSKCTIGAIASKKASARLVGQRADRLGERGRGQRAGGDDDLVPVGRRQARDLAALDGDERMGLEAAR